MWFVLYCIVSIIMGTFYTTITFKETDLDDFCFTTKVLFMLYFEVANLICWPIFTVMSASLYLNDDILNR